MKTQPLSVEEAFLLAVERPPVDRPAFLAASCADGNVRTRVEALLKAHDSAGTFLEAPAIKPARSVDSHTVHDGDTAIVHEPVDFLDPCPTADRLGLLAHYEILDIVGRGGMGIVLRGLDVKLNRMVAIKILAPQLAADSTARQRFRREAQAAAAVSHAHVVAVYAVDEFKGLPFLTMEYISGVSLQQRLDDSGALQLHQILRIGMQIASGLAAAHAQGLVHRDIKPANILLENGIERVKISDFGLARSLHDVRMTQAGAVYGTPQYMSPEQAQGERVDQRSDLFSLGGVMYAMCTGRPPFRGDNNLAVLKRVCEESPQPIRDLKPNVPLALVEIIEKLLAKHPDARYQSAGEVAELLSRYLTHLQNDPLTPFPCEQPERQKPPPRRRPMRVVAALMLLGLAVLGVLEAARVTHWTGLNTPQKLASENPPPAPAAPGQLTRYPPGTTDRPVKIFILAGDSNMAGRAKVSLLKHQARSDERFQKLINDNEPVVRDDVWIKNFHQKGSLTAGFGQSPDRFGPELEFGHVVGDRFDEQVLLIKTCWGGHDLNRDFRPPSAGLPPPDSLEQIRKELQKLKPDVTIAEVEKTFGLTYRAMLTEVRETLTNLGEHFPDYKGQGFQIAGFVWFSGWTDMVKDNPFYAEHLAHFIRDVRREFNAPNLPFIIGQMGVGGISDPGTNGSYFRAAQASVAQIPEFKGNVTLVPTDPFWDREAAAVYAKGWREHIAEWEKVGSDLPYHYLGSARTFAAIGQAFGEAMMEISPR